MIHRQSSTLLFSTLVLFLMLGFQNCGRTEKTVIPEGTYHKIENSTVVDAPIADNSDLMIEDALLNFESEEMANLLKTRSYEEISKDSTACYEMQENCIDLMGTDRKSCYELKIRQFLTCHKYHVSSSEECVIAANHLTVATGETVRIVSVCFDHPYFVGQKNAPGIRRAIHIGECQESDSQWGKGWRAANQIFNVYDLAFESVGAKKIDLAEESSNRSVLQDSCRETQQAQFLHVDLQIQVQ